MPTCASGIWGEGIDMGVKYSALKHAVIRMTIEIETGDLTTPCTFRLQAKSEKAKALLKHWSEKTPNGPGLPLNSPAIVEPFFYTDNSARKGISEYALSVSKEE